MHDDSESAAIMKILSHKLSKIWDILDHNSKPQWTHRTIGRMKNCEIAQFIYNYTLYKIFEEYFRH